AASCSPASSSASERGRGMESTPAVEPKASRTGGGDRDGDDRAGSTVEQARAWLADDPDEATRGELSDLLERVEAGDSEARHDLEDRFSGFLEFGTAGLRGALGPGPNRMTRAVVIRTAAGLTAYLPRRLEDAGDRTPGPAVVVGFDARHNSDVFARDTAAVVEAAGGRAMVLP